MALQQLLQGPHQPRKVGATQGQQRHLCSGSMHAGIVEGRTGKLGRRLCAGSLQDGMKACAWPDATGKAHWPLLQASACLHAARPTGQCSHGGSPRLVEEQRTLAKVGGRSQLSKLLHPMVNERGKPSYCEPCQTARGVAAELQDTTGAPTAVPHVHTCSKVDRCPAPRPDASLISKLRPSPPRPPAPPCPPPRSCPPQ